MWTGEEQYLQLNNREMIPRTLWALRACIRKTGHAHPFRPSGIGTRDCCRVTLKRPINQRSTESTGFTLLHPCIKRLIIRRSACFSDRGRTLSTSGQSRRSIMLALVDSPGLRICLDTDFCLSDLWEMTVDLRQYVVPERPLLSPEGVYPIGRGGISPLTSLLAGFPCLFCWDTYSTVVSAVPPPVPGLFHILRTFYRKTSGKRSPPWAEASTST